VERVLAALLPSSGRRAALALGASVLLGVALIAAVGEGRLFDGLRLAPQPYPDITVGNITWAAVYKDFDLLLVMGLLAMFFALFLLATVLLNRSRGPRLEDARTVGSRVPVAVGLWGGVAAYTGVLAVFPRMAPRQELAATAALGVSVLASHLWMLRTRGAAELPAFSRRYVAALVAAFGLFCSALGTVAAVRFFSPTALPGTETWGPRLVLPLLGVATLAAVVVDARLSAGGWRRLALACQALSPLLILPVGYDAYRQGSTLFHLHVPAWTRALVFGCAALGVLAVLARARRAGAEEAEGPAPASLLAWPTVVAVACYLAFTPVVFSALVAGDDFHYGESLLPWQQVMELRQELYFGFVSIQWALGLLYGALNRVFFEGTAASFLHAYALWPLLVTALNAVLLSRRLGTGWALALCVVAMPVTDRHYLVLPLLLVLASPSLLARPAAWLGAWAGLSVAHGFYNPSAGAALGVALLPVAGVLALRLARELPRSEAGRRWRWVAGLAVGFVLLALVARPLYGLFLFLRENGSVNATAYGISLVQFPFVPDWFPSRDRLLWEGLRIGGWLLGAVVLWALFCRARARADVPDGERESAQVLNLGALAFLVLMVPYSMGRIDPGVLSRPGTLSMLSLGFLIPCALVLDARRAGHFLAVTVIVGALMGLRTVASAFEAPRLLMPAPTPLEPARLLTRPLAPIPVPEGVALVEGRDLGLPNLGRLFAPADRLQDIQRFGHVLEALLEPGETYLDLTNRSANYYFLGRRVPAHYAADYTAVGYAVQRRVLGTLEREPPPLVWLGPGMRHDGGPASLRSYRVYRWLLTQGYRYHARDGFELLLRPDRYAARVAPGGDAKAEADGLLRTFHAPYLDAIPSSWGRSWERLAPRFDAQGLSLEAPELLDVEQEPEGWLRASGVVPRLIWKLPRPVSGREFDFLRLEFECRDATDPWPRGLVLWASPTAPYAVERSFSLATGRGGLLIPLGSHPSWLLGNDLSELRFDLQTSEGCAAFRVRGARLVYLAD
jgi:hypothetical protein